MSFDLSRRADGASSAAGNREQVPSPLVVRPDVGAPGQVLAEDIMMAERVAEEPESIEPPAARLLGIRMAGEAAYHRDVGVDAVADRDARLGLDDLVIFAHPFDGFGGIDEREGERADAVARRLVDRLAARGGDPDRRVGGFARALLYAMLHRTVTDVSLSPRTVAHH